MRNLDLADQVERFLLRIPKKHAGQIMRKISLLLVNPHPSDSKELRGIPMRRADSGEYRIIYTADDATVFVYLVGKRNDDDVYRKLDRLK